MTKVLLTLYGFYAAERLIGFFKWKSPFLYDKVLIKIVFDTVYLFKFKFKWVIVSGILKCMYYG